MLAAKDLQSIANACISVSNEIADASGFVSVRKLLERFDISLVIRPLLVEGMLASIPAERGESLQTKMTVLVDSESFGVDVKEVAMEDSNRPLPPRFRSTVAHELLHSLAFKPTNIGLRLEQDFTDEGQAGEVVKAIEAETERLTPLLLWPEKALDLLIATRSKPITPGELSNLVNELGISRQTAINRLRLRAQKEGIIYAPWLRDVAIGVGVWTDSGQAVFLKWPLFVNFDRNIAPGFLYRVAARDRVPASEVFETKEFAMRGGHFNSTTMLVEAGLKSSPNLELMPTIFSMEDGERKPGSEFFFVVRKRRSDDEPSNRRETGSDEE